ncbi:signal peptidase I [Ruminococcaceae bacterium YRB3002]|nr:signal peptidase I [Ruminococcaceae bacterium YRB3002]
MSEAVDTAPKPASDPKPDAKPKAKAKKRKKTSVDYAIEFAIKVAVTVAVVAVLLIFIVGVHVNHGNSSYPMIKDGDLVITYKLGGVNEGEEIAYKADGEIRFGRIVAKAGDVVDITESYLTVNGYGITEDVVYPTTSEGAKITFPFTVPADSVFVLNDFRADINDSRSLGGIPLSDCEGKVVLLLRRRGI